MASTSMSAELRAELPVRKAELEGKWGAWAADAMALAARLDGLWARYDALMAEKRDLYQDAALLRVHLDAPRIPETNRALGHLSGKDRPVSLR